jgi:ATP-dependent RNA helicase DDX49/DBP8
MVPKMKERIEIRVEQPSLPPSSPPSDSGKAEEPSDGEHSSDFDVQDDTLPPKKRRKVSSSSRSPSFSSPLSTPRPSSQLSVSTTSAFPTPSRIKKKQHQNANGTHSGQVEPDPVTSQDARDLGLQVTDSTFADLNVAPWLVNSLSTMAIRRPTAIQRACIPELLKGRDCIGGSRTGSGKTVAFAVPILQTWAEDPFGTFAVVLTPTRLVVAFSLL